MHRLLIIEDSEYMQFMYKRLFRDEPDIELTVVDTAEEGLTILQDFNPELIIVDLLLPGMNGIDFTRKVRQHSSTCMIIVATGNSQESVLEEALKAGACKVVSKDIGKAFVQKARELMNLAEPANKG